MILKCFPFSSQEIAWNPKNWKRKRYIFSHLEFWIFLDHKKDGHFELKKKINLNVIIFDRNRDK